jgi:4-hydroxybenzoate polyprenyltransferase
MTSVHIALGSLLIVLNLLAGAIGGFAWYRQRPSVPFWYLLRAAQATVILEALLGGVLILAGRVPDESLHYLYGTLPLLVSFLAEGARVGAAEREVRDIDMHSLSTEAQEAVALAIVRREMGIMAVSCGVILFLGLRAAFT